MGSKMAAASRVVQVVKPHTPLIKFPDRKSTPKPKMQESLHSRVPPLHGTASQFSAENKAPSFQNTLFTGRIQGIPDTAELIRTLPQKYRRKLMSVEEMEYIQTLRRWLVEKLQEIKCRKNIARSALQKHRGGPE